ncbi:MAG TPA: GNAT family N-acetyltransferase [Jatrophihabitans sp.]|nr:GNAT family N-acetyltransferase [Jatrophihabitans sp.]
MDIELRQATPDDYPEIARIDGISFGESYSEQAIADIFAAPPELLVATERGRLVGVAGQYRFELTTPGLAVLPVPGLTWVSVLPTHRRRGVLTAMLGELAARDARAGSACSLLTASEGGIYRRFGYGPATTMVKFSVNRRLTALRAPVDTGQVELLTAEVARTRLPELHDRWRRQLPGGLSRDAGWWDYLLLDREHQRGGLSEKVYLVHPDGYVAYRAGEHWNDGEAANRCVVVDYRVLTPQAHAALWQVLLGLDLFATIESWQVPVDDPLPFLLTDPRQVRTVAARDGMWLRPVEPAALLAGRRYAVDFDTVLDLDGQRLALAGGPDGARCAPTDRPAELWLDRPGLGSIYLGGHRLGALARAGLARADDPAVLARLDLAFLADRSPQYGTDF